MIKKKTFVKSKNLRLLTIPPLTNVNQTYRDNQYMSTPEWQTLIQKIVKKTPIYPKYHS